MLKTFRRVSDKKGKKYGNSECQKLCNLAEKNPLSNVNYTKFLIKMLITFFYMERTV